MSLLDTAEQEKILCGRKCLQALARPAAGWLALLLITIELILLLLLPPSWGAFNLDDAAQLEDPKSLHRVTMLTSSDVYKAHYLSFSEHLPQHFDEENKIISSVL